MAFSLRVLSSLLLAGAALGLSAAAHAETELSIYGGTNWNLESDVTTKKGAVNDTRSVDWDGKSFEMPPYWGVRGTYWMERSSPWGVALDYTHQKAYADIDFAADPVYDHLEFTDGNNIITLNALYRFRQDASPWSMYVGGGPGVAFPSVEVTLDAFPGQETHEYQLTGFAAQALAGAQYKFTDHIAVFAEAKMSYTQIDGDIDGGGTVETDIWSPHALVGLSYIF